MKVYSTTSKTGTDFEVYTLKGGGGKDFEFIIDDGTLKNYGIVTLDVEQIQDLIKALKSQILAFSINRLIADNSSRCGCTVNDGCGEWSDVAALKAYNDDGRLE